jgi:hypothetical protein
VNIPSEKIPSMVGAQPSLHIEKLSRMAVRIFRQLEIPEP